MVSYAAPVAWCNKEMSKAVASTMKDFIPRALWGAAFPGTLPVLRVAWRVENGRLASMVAPKLIRSREDEDDNGDEQSYQRRIARRRWEAVVVVL